MKQYWENKNVAPTFMVGYKWGMNPHATAWRDRLQGFSDERGTALVIAMIFLGLLTTIGIYALLSTSTELIGSASYKSNKEAFYAAEGAIEYVKGDGYYFTTKGTLDFPENILDSHPNITLAAEDTDATGTIKYITSGNPPPGYGFSAKDTMSSYFMIEATGTSRAGVQNTQEEGVAKILPKG
ncbi:MAG: pilus assembly PilX N-terminal domain-containing protein [Nitrospirae bacterium]|nr:pilus assembly PilX N-terminal domain-containing protein [Nitrospirota bacterium]